MSVGNIPDDLRVPLVWIDIDNSMAMDGAPAQVRKILMVGQQQVAGTAPELTLSRITSDSASDALYGRGSMLAEMLKIHRRGNTYTETWSMGLPELTTGNAAKATVTTKGTPTAAGTLALMVNGVSVQIAVEPEADKSDIATAIADAINALPATQVTATVAAEVVTLTVNWKGATGNDASVCLNYYPGESTPPGLTVTATSFTGGTGTPDISAVVASLGDNWFTDIIFPYTDTRSLDTIRDELLTRWGPLRMMEAQLWSAYRGTHAASGTFGAARNDWLISCLSTNLAPQPSWLWAAAYGSKAAYHLAIDPARPLQTLVLAGILPPPRDIRWDVPERNILLHDGMATHFVDASENVCIEREITMYRVNQYGDPDTSYLDVQSPATLGRIRYIIKNRFTSRYPRHKLADDDVLDVLEPGQPVMTPRIATAELLDIALTELIPAGLVEDFEDYKSSLEVWRDKSDRNRLNFVCHPNLVNQLRVLAGLIQFRQ
ncbi:TPA: phage tail sheath subtilisin-like domain-containing protein [Citrobacter amalonaticus]